jgi:hypothetical protein
MRYIYVVIRFFLNQPLMKKTEKVIIDEFEEERLLLLHNLLSGTSIEEFISLLKHGMPYYFSSKGFRETHKDERTRESYRFNDLMEFLYEMKAIGERAGRPFGVLDTECSLNVANQ